MQLIKTKMFEGGRLNYSIKYKQFQMKTIDEKTGDKKIVPSKFKTELWDDNEAQLGNRVDINPLDCIGKRCRIRPFFV